MSQPWPLTGREEELDFLVARMRRGRGSGAVIAGGAGVGKTRLARELMDTSGAVGPCWVVGTTSARPIPLGAFASTLAADLTADPASLRRAAAAIAANGRPGKVVVGVDDAHLLDDLSASLVHQIALAGEVPLLVTVRSGERAPDAITALWKDGLLERLELQPLSRRQTVRLVEAVLEGPLDSRSANRMWTASAGNALFLRQLVVGELEAGHLRADAGLWQWAGDVAITPRLTELLDARVGRLPARLVRVAELLAFGEPLGVELIDHLVGGGAAEDAERRGLISVESDGSRIEARLVHPLYAEVVRPRTGAVAARRVYGQLAAALSATGMRRPGDLLRLAVWTLEADAEPQAAMLTEAARRATALTDLGLGERLARAAVRAGAGVTAALTLGDTLSLQGRAGEAEEVLAGLSLSGLTDDQLVGVTVARAANLCWNLDRPIDAELLLQDAQGRVTGPAGRDELGAVDSFYRLLRNRPVEGLKKAEVICDSTTSDSAAIWSTGVVVAASAVIGRRTPSSVAEHARTVTARSVEAGALRVGLSWAEVMAHRLSGDLDEAEDCARRCAEPTEHDGWGHPRVTLLLGQVTLDRGQVRAALRWLREAAAGFSDGRFAGWRFESLFGLTQALGMSGDAHAARESLAETAAAYRPSVELFLPQLHLAEAWVCAAEGATTQAVAFARQAAVVAGRAGQLAIEGLALHTAVCFGDRTAAGRLTELAAQVDGPRMSAAAAHAAALADDDGAALASASARLHGIGALLLAADASAQAVTAYRRHNHGPGATLAWTTASRLADACQGAHTPALTAAARPLPLTDREREIASLIAYGLSNKQIAERLVVSVRTVEGHIYRACTKLDITDRSMLALTVDPQPGQRGERSRCRAFQADG